MNIKALLWLLLKSWAKKKRIKRGVAQGPFSFLLLSFLSFVCVCVCDSRGFSFLFFCFEKSN